MGKVFDAFEEFKAGRYEYIASLGLGKFDLCYYVSDVRGETYALFTYKSVPRIAEQLPKECFVPRSEHIELWSRVMLNHHWKNNPKGFCSIFVDETCDFVTDYLSHARGGLVITMDDCASMFGRSSKHGRPQPFDEATSRPSNLLCYRQPKGRHKIECCSASDARTLFYVPVFFTETFYKSNSGK